MQVRQARNSLMLSALHTGHGCRSPSAPSVCRYSGEPRRTFWYGAHPCVQRGRLVRENIGRPLYFSRALSIIATRMSRVSRGGRSKLPRYRSDTSGPSMSIESSPGAKRRRAQYRHWQERRWESQSSEVKSFVVEDVDAYLESHAWHDTEAQA